MNRTSELSDSHESVSCNVCGSMNFSGRRYKCLKCDDYDLCETCHMGRRSNEEHTYSHAEQIVFTPFEFDELFGDPAIARELGLFDFRETPVLAVSFTCPHCGNCGYTVTEFVEHLRSLHLNSAHPVLCPVCAAIPGDDSNLSHENLAAHIEMEHLITDGVSSYQRATNRRNVNPSRIRLASSRRRPGYKGVGGKTIAVREGTRVREVQARDRNQESTMVSELLHHIAGSSNRTGAAAFAQSQRLPTYASESVQARHNVWQNIGRTEESRLNTRLERFNDIIREIERDVTPSSRAELLSFGVPVSNGNSEYSQARNLFRSSLYFDDPQADDSQYNASKKGGAKSTTNRNQGTTGGGNNQSSNNNNNNATTASNSFHSDVNSRSLLLQIIREDERDEINTNQTDRANRSLFARELFMAALQDGLTFSNDEEQARAVPGINTWASSSSNRLRNMDRDDTASIDSTQAGTYGSVSERSPSELSLASIDEELTIAAASRMANTGLDRRALQQTLSSLALNVSNLAQDGDRNVRRASDGRGDE